MSLTRDRARVIAQDYLASAGTRDGGTHVRHVLRYGELWFAVRALHGFPLARLDSCWIAYVDRSDRGTPLGQILLIDQDSGEVFYTLEVSDES